MNIPDVVTPLLALLAILYAALVTCAWVWCPLLVALIATVPFVVGVSLPIVIWLQDRKEPKQ